MMNEKLSKAKNDPAKNVPSEEISDAEFSAHPKKKPRRKILQRKIFRRRMFRRRILQRRILREPSQLPLGLVFVEVLADLKPTVIGCVLKLTIRTLQLLQGQLDALGR
jgi:hypothetical protein